MIRLVLHVGSCRQKGESMRHGVVVRGEKDAVNAEFCQKRGDVAIKMLSTRLYDVVAPDSFIKSPLTNSDIL